MSIAKYKQSIQSILSEDSDGKTIEEKFLKLRTSNNMEELFQIQLTKQWISRNYCCDPVMIVIGCAIRAILSLFQKSQQSPETIKNGLKSFRLWFPEFDQIGLPSIAGTVLRTSISGSVSLKKRNKLYEQNHYHIEEANGIVVKFPNIGYEDASWREYMIGLELNKLRQDVPNFMYMFGLYECNVIHKNENPTSTMCTRDSSKVPFTMMQFIKGEPFKSFLEKNALSFEDIVIIMLQVCLALTFAKLMFNFQHNDMHVGNIMIVHEFPPKTITYPLAYRGNKNISITTSWIPILIDFGMSSMFVTESNEQFDPPKNSRNDVELLVGNVLSLTKGALNAGLKIWFPHKYTSSMVLIERIFDLIPEQFGSYIFDKKTFNISSKGNPTNPCTCKDTPDSILQHLFEKPIKKESSLLKRRRKIVLQTIPEMIPTPPPKPPST